MRLTSKAELYRNAVLAWGLLTVDAWQLLLSTAEEIARSRGAKQVALLHLQMAEMRLEDAAEPRGEQEAK